MPLADPLLSWPADVEPYVGRSAMFTDLNRSDLLVTAESLLSLQRETLDGWARLKLLTKQYREAALDERPALQDEFDEISASMLANAEQLREIIVRHYRPE